jgi:hypothetical protein
MSDYLARERLGALIAAFHDEFVEGRIAGRGICH